MFAQSGGQEEEIGALQLLVKEYVEYEKKYTKSLMTITSASSSNCGRFWISLFQSCVSGRAFLLVASADPDVL